MREWRRPALGPVYALVTGFVVTLGAGLPAASAGSVRVQVVAEDGHHELAGSTVELRDAAGRPVAVDALSAAGTAELPARGGTICLRLPPQWRVVEPAGRCAAPPAGGGTVRVTVTRDARVEVRFRPPGGAAPEDLTVTVQDGTGRVLESGPPDASGLYRPRTPLAGRTVCVTPPPGWTVRGAADAAPGCDGPVTDPHDDFRLALVRSEDGAG